MMTPEIIQAIVAGIVTIVSAVASTIVALRAHTTATTAINANSNAPVVTPMVATETPKASEVRSI